MKIDIETKDGLKKLENVLENKRKRIVKEYPEAVIYACKSWSKNKEQFRELVLDALSIEPELIINFKGKNGLVVTDEYYEKAVLTDPMILIKMNEEMRERISPELFLKAFVKNPLVLNIKDLSVLKHKFVRTIEVMSDEGVEEKKLSTSLRTECLKAIRLAENVSKYYKGYDDIALAISKNLIKSKDYQKGKYSEELLKNFATLMNAMIKKSNQKLRACSIDAWLVNRGKPMYKAVRTSAKEGSELDGLLGDMPTALLPDKIVKKLVIAAVKVNPEIYLKLESYGLSRFVGDNTVKYNVYKSLKKHGMMEQVNGYLDENDIKKSSGKLSRLENKISKKDEMKEKKIQTYMHFNRPEY